jgi:transposase-like protein
MGKGAPVSEDEEKAILEALESGKSQTQTAKDFDRSPDTIHRIAARHGLEYSGPKNANIARTCYASADRIKLVGKLLDKAEELIKTCSNPRDLQPLAMAIAIGIDKRRLEEATDPSARGGEIRILFEKMGEEGEA